MRLQKGHQLANARAQRQKEYERQQVREALLRTTTRLRNREDQLREIRHSLVEARYERHLVARAMKAVEKLNG